MRVAPGLVVDTHNLRVRAVIGHDDGRVPTRSVFWPSDHWRLVFANHSYVSTICNDVYSALSRSVSPAVRDRSHGTITDKRVNNNRYRVLRERSVGDVDAE